MVGNRSRHIRRGACPVKLYLGETEVEDLRLNARSNKNISGLQVAMNDAFGMCGLEGVDDLNPESQHRFDIERAAANSVGERFTVE